LTELLFGGLQGDAVGHLVLRAGHLFLLASKLILIGAELLYCVPQGSEISRNGLKLLLKFCKTYRWGSRLAD
jgi:hypothetical protein